METTPATNPKQDAATVALPPRSVATKALQSLQIGDTATIAADPGLVARIAAGMPGRHFTVTATPGATPGATVTRTRHPAGSLRQRLSEMRPGQTILVTDAPVDSVRSGCSAYARLTGATFRVTAHGPSEATVACLGTADQPPAPEALSRARYPFATTAIGQTFTLPAGKHSGLATIRASCSRYSSEDPARAFVARQNIDGSITVRCYAKGAKPARWVLDAEHAARQQAITEAQQEDA